LRAAFGVLGSRQNGFNIRGLGFGARYDQVSMDKRLMIVALMGVSGSGKTTIGKALAQRLNYGFADADDWHSNDNRDKMRRGIPLTDGDRHPWLQALRSSIEDWVREDLDVVLACSALKQSYRDQLSPKLASIQWVYLKGRVEVIQQRLQARVDHFMPSALLESQFITLEEPTDALTVDIDQPIDAIVMAIASHVEALTSGHH
jgi:gluconokinase